MYFGMVIITVFLMGFCGVLFRNKFTFKAPDIVSLWSWRIFLSKTN